MKFKICVWHVYNKQCRDSEQQRFFAVPQLFVLNVVSVKMMAINILLYII